MYDYFSVPSAKTHPLRAHIKKKTPARRDARIPATSSRGVKKRQLFLPSSAEPVDVVILHENRKTSVATLRYTRAGDPVLGKRHQTPKYDETRNKRYYIFYDLNNLILTNEIEIPFGNRMYKLQDYELYIN